MGRLLREVDLPDRLSWAFHNAVIHPLMVVLPRSWGEWLHEKTVPKRKSLNRDERVT